MTTSTTTLTATDALDTVIRHWAHLTDMLTTRHGATWPPPGRMVDYLASLDAIDGAEVRARRAADRAAERNPDQIGEGRAPIRLDVFDTIRAVEAVLLHTADQIAADIQRPAHPVPRASAGPLDELGRQMRLAALADEADARRWHWNGDDRTGATAATWLRDRYAGAPGPFRVLTDPERLRIENIAQTAAQRVERALDLTRQTTPITQPCPHCRGELVIESGDGTDPTVRCTSTACGWTRTTTETAA